MPLAIWFLAWKISGKNRTIATLSSLICVWLSVDYHFVSAAFPLGLDYFSTFQIGLYAQPLGFILLLVWLFVYQDEELNLCKIGVASVLLALVILANFFCAITTCVFIFAHLVNDLSAFIFKKISLTQFRQKTFRRLFIPVLALCLSAFWLVPMISQYKYFVTRPTHVALFPSPTVWIFYALALLGCIVWLRKCDTGKFYVFACACLGILIFFISPIAPSWFPFQTNSVFSQFQLSFVFACRIFSELCFCKDKSNISRKNNFYKFEKTKSCRIVCNYHGQLFSD